MMVGELAHLIAGQAQTESELAALVWLQACRGVDVGRQDLLRLGPGHLFNIHTTCRGGHEDHPRTAAVEQCTQIDLPLDGTDCLHQHGVHRQTFAAALTGNEAATEHTARGILDFLAAANFLDTTGLTATTRVHLGLYDPLIPPDVTRGRGRLARAVGGPSLRNGDTVLCED